MNVLFSCSGRRNYLINYFKEVIGDKGLTIAVDSQSTASSFADADISFQVPSIQEQSYIPMLLEIIKSYKVDLLIPLNDWELPVIARNKKELEKYGAKVIVSDIEVIETFADKWLTYNYLSSVNIKTPKTFIDYQSCLKSLKSGEVKFPIIVKPRMGSGSLNVMEANDFEELELVYRIQNKKIESTNCLTGFVFQEMLNGVEYGMDILNDFNGNYIGSFAREKLSMRCGETDKAISVIDEKFELIAKKISESTKHIGSVDCDFFVSNDEIYFLEINPRFGGGYPFSHEAGINIPAIYNSWLSNDCIKEFLSQYKDGIMFSKCSKIVRLQSIIKSPFV